MQRITFESRIQGCANFTIDQLVVFAHDMATLAVAGQYDLHTHVS